MRGQYHSIIVDNIAATHLPLDGSLI